MAQRQLLFANQSIQAARGTNYYVRVCFLIRQNFHIFLERSTTIKDGSLHVRKILAESGVFVLDLIRQLSRVAHDQDRALPRDRLQLVKSRQNKHRSLPETGLGLAKDIDVQNSCRNAHLLDCREAEKNGMLEFAFGHSQEEEDSNR